MPQKRYYYKSKNGNSYLNLKSPLKAEELDNYTEITEEQFNEETYVAPVEPVEPTAEEIRRQDILARINQLKGLLKETDYQAIKYAEGWFTKTEYAETKTQRQAWRDEINQLQTELEGNEETVEETESENE